MGKLGKQIKKAILNSKDYADFLETLVKKINKESAKANSEETVAFIIESNIKEALGWHNYEFTPIREQIVKTAVRDRIVSKRLDSRYQNVICEYKKNLTDTKIEKDSNQLLQYIQNIAPAEKQPLTSYVGVLTDGRKIRFLLPDIDTLKPSPLFPFNVVTFKELIKTYLSLDRRNLSSKNLLTDFSITTDNSPSKKLVNTLYKCLENPTERAFMLHSEWERLFRLASHNENNMQKIKARKKAMLACFSSISTDLNDAKGLFALQTAYTVIIKLAAYHIVSGIFFKQSNLRFNDLLKLDEESLRVRLECIENGDVFKDLGIKNLLEGDFFSWYTEKKTWNTDVYKAIAECAKTLSVYDDNQLLFDRTNVHDLFIDLYQSIIPREVRHSLGEYYTPNWLAEHVVKNIEKPKSWRGLDPCAGSGTFVINLIQEVMSENKNAGEQNRSLLNDVLNRVKAIDINPLSVLTCRINYFLAISHLIEENNDMLDIEIPVYLGDSAFVPSIIEINHHQIVNYSITTKKGGINFSLPMSVVSDDEKLNQSALLLEKAIINQSKSEAMEIILGLMKKNEREDTVILSKAEEFIDNLLYLEKQNWNRIWVRIILGFLKVATLGKFEVIVGNPPWIDWKALPDGYRDTLKSICIERHLFSGDNFTGGINLNICALIANVTANNWLKPEGSFAFLMPKSLAFQQSYAGFRDLIQNDGINLKYFKFYDWSQAGHPFHPVTEKFMSYYFKKTKSKQKFPIECTSYKIKKRASLKESGHASLAQILKKIEGSAFYAFMNKGTFNNFTFENNLQLIPEMQAIAGDSAYKGRVGLGLYPKELLLFKMIKTVGANKLYVENYQGKGTERKFAKRTALLEAKHIYPVIEGPNIGRFKIKDVNFLAPFPYTEQDIKKPIEPNILEKESPLLYSYYKNNQTVMKKTDYNQRVQGRKGAFYSLTRVGQYTFAKHRVIYRNNTKWVAAVISDASTAWGGKKKYLLLDHACSIGQDNEDNFITEDEAHYICAILNSNIVARYIVNSSDSRSYKTDIPINIVKYNSKLWVHTALAAISKVAHKGSLAISEADKIIDWLMKRYIKESLKSLSVSTEDSSIEKKCDDFKHTDWAKKLLLLIK